MRRITTSFFILILIFLSSCTNTAHFISDKSEREIVYREFNERASKLDNDSLFNVFNKEITPLEKEALTFLYAYMPLSDIADHSGDYFLENVRYSMKAKEEMPWGKVIPEREFRHFVLPIRVNNENLDDSRKVFYEELKDRVKNLSLHDAVLEVNHWCHEKVVYTPSDSRTSSPLASVKTAYGRCGEESTFTVAALRSVGIPARQVYTPRWAHTDDNHAWVEAWVDGKWFFLGACEPEPVLNLGWFNAPASRGMLMHTKVFGRYNGPEEKMYVNPRYTEINVTDNYAPTSKVVVKVTDKDGNNVENAKVDFKVYNYAEFYTVASKNSDKNGEVSLTAGKGDMLVWAYKDGKFGYKKVSFTKDDRTVVVLDMTPGGKSFTDMIDIIPPKEGNISVEVTEEQREGNNKKLHAEDSIRNAYVSTFMNEDSAGAFAKENGYDKEKVTKLLIASRGNFDVIKSFLSSLKDNRSKENGLALLNAISAKDLRDVTLDVLNDNISNYNGDDVDNILNPRVSNELLKPYKSFFKKAIPENEVDRFRKSPDKLAEFVKSFITVDDSCNLGGAPISPMGVWMTKVADKHSRDIFFVSLARSLDIPARIDEVTGKVQIMSGIAKDVVFFSEDLDKNVSQGRVVASYQPTKSLADPKYYSHFTISKINQDCSVSLLNYDEGDVDMGVGATWSNLLKRGTTLDAGDYMLVTGTRLANGGVLANMTFFNIEPDKTTDISFVMRESTNDVEVIGNFNSESKYRSIGSKDTKSILSTTGRGYFVVGILGVGQEPTNHALRDIVQLSGEFNKWGRKMILLFPDESQYKKFNPNEFKGLPSTIDYGTDVDKSIQNQIVKQMKLVSATNLPIFIIADTFNRVVFVSQGYTIGLGEQMMKVIDKL